MGRAVLHGLLFGAGIGAFFGLLFGLVGLFEQHGAGLALVFYGIAVGGLAGALVGFAAFMAAGGRFRAGPRG